MLFTTTRPVYEKTAAARLLSNNPGSWHNELLAQLFEQNSYLGTYKVDLSVSTQNDEAGYLHGFFVISPQTYPQQGQDQQTGTVVGQPVPQPQMAQPQAAQPQPGQEQMAQPGQAPPTASVPQDPAAAGVPSVRIPVIVAKRKTFPMDIMIDADGQFQPLTESRLAAILSQDTLSQVVDAPQEDQYSQSQFTPPGGAQNGRGVTFEKAGHLLSKVASSIPDSRREAFFNEISTPEGQWALENCRSLRDAVGILYRSKTASAPSLKSEVPPTTAVLTKTASGFTLTTANESAYEPHSVSYARNQAAALPQEMVVEAMETGISIVSLPVPYTPDESDFEIAKTAGLYASLQNGVFVERSMVPCVYSLDGTQQRQVLSVGGSGHSYQEKVAGVLLGPGEFTSQEPSGFGAFVSPDGIRATVPLHVQGRDATYGHFIKVAGRSARLRKMAGIRIPQQIQNDAFAVPSDWFFQSLGESARVESEPMLAKQASAKQDSLRVVRLVDGGPGEVSLSGGCGVGLLPHERREHVKIAEAALLMGCLGLDAETIHEKLAACKKNGATSFHAGKSVTTLKARKAKAKAKIAEFTQWMRLEPVNLIKEATLLANEDSVDTVLALNFLTADNVQHYVDRLPELEQACKSMAEIAIMARMGQRDVPESAATRAMTGLDKVVEGLKLLQLSLQQATEAV